MPSAPPQKNDPSPECDEITPFEHFCDVLNQNQWPALVIFFIGIALWFFLDHQIGLFTIGGSLILSGLYPIITRRYRGPFGIWTGFKAILRGFVSVLFGLGVIGMGLM